MMKINRHFQELINVQSKFMYIYGRDNHNLALEKHTHQREYLGLK